MKRLFEKELRAVLPYHLAVLVVALGDVVDTLVRRFDIGRPSVDLVENALTPWLVVGGLVCFAVGLYSLASELRDGTIELLDGLPIGRLQIYRAKLLAGLTVVASTLISALAPRMLEAVVGAGPFDPSYTPALASHALLLLAAYLGFYGAGLGLAWAGEVAWLLLGVGAMALEVLAKIQPTIAAVNISGYLAFAYEGSRPRLLMWAPSFWAGCFVAGLLIAGRWIQTARPSSGSRLSRALYRGVLVSGGLVLFLGAWGLGSVYFDELIGMIREEPTVRSAGLFTVMFRPEEEEEATELLKELGRIDRAVQMQLETDRPIALDIELMGAGSFHLGEQWGRKIRMRLGEHADRVLAHELAHAHIHALAGEGGELNSDAWRFFNEGLATWISTEVTGNTEEVDRFDAWAGVIWSKKQASFDFLLQPSKRKRRFDDHQIYPLGLTFVRALIAVGGEAAPPCILRSMAPLGEVADPFTFWFATARACDVDLDGVVREYEARLADLAPARPPQLPKGRLVRRAGHEVVEIIGSSPDVICRFRPTEDAPDAQLKETSGSGGSCYVPRRSLGPRSAWVQIGTVLDGGSKMFGEWVELPRPTPLCPTLSCAEPLLRPWSALPGAAPRPRLELQRLHAGRITASALSPEGDLLVTASRSDETIRLWDAASLRLLRVLRGTEGIEHVEVSADGRFVLTVGKSGTIALWRASNGKRLWQHRARSYGAAAALFERHALVLLRERRSGGLQLLDAQYGKPIVDIASSTVAPGAGQDAWLEVGPKGEHAVVLLEEGGLRSVDLFSGRVSIIADLGPIESAVIADDLSRVAVYQDDRVRLVSTVTGQVTRTIEVENRSTSLELRDDGALFIGQRGQVKRVLGDEVRTLDVHRSEGALSLGAGGEMLFAASYSGRGGILDLRTNAWRPMSGVAPAIRGLAVDRTGRPLTGVKDRVVAWDPSTCTPVKSWRGRIEGWVRSLASPADDGRFAVVDDQGQVFFGTPEERGLVPGPKVEDHYRIPMLVLDSNRLLVRDGAGGLALFASIDHPARSRTFDADIEAFARVGEDEVVMGMDDGALLRVHLDTLETEPFADGAYATHLASDPAATFLASAKVDDVVLLEAKTGRERWRVEDLSFVDALGFDARGRWLAVATEGGSIVLLAIEDGHLVRRFRSDPLEEMVVLAGTARIATLGADGILTVWSSDTGQALCRATMDEEGEVVRWTEDAFYGRPELLRANLHIVSGRNASPGGSVVQRCAEQQACPRAVVSPSTAQPGR